MKKEDEMIKSRLCVISIMSWRLNHEPPNLELGWTRLGSLK